ncbi:MAG: VWA domain-containing protein, partial [Pirellulaceae bacterium]|nr:VWA domain-containing protein [Pirellulaceae bacterium]
MSSARRGRAPARRQSRLVRRRLAHHQPPHRARLGWLEQLEDRRLLASDWQNPFLTYDVNNDGMVSPVDPLVIINEINTRSVSSSDGRLPDRADHPQAPYWDTSGDGLLTPIDVLRTIIYLGQNPGGGSANPVIATDASSYLPGDVVTVTAQGLAAGDELQIGFQHVDPATGNYPLVTRLVTDGGAGDLDGQRNGRIATAWTIPLDTSRDATLRAEARNTRTGKSASAPIVLEPLGGPANVATDKRDYSARETARITAAGFQVGETVQFQVLHTDGTPNTGNGHEPWLVEDGGPQDGDGSRDGNVSTTWYVDPDDSLNSHFELTATGLTSGRTASTTFTDAVNPDLVSACGLDIIFILDESSSIIGAGGVNNILAEVRHAALTFLDVLADTTSRLAIVEFNTNARTPIPTYVPITSGPTGTIATIFEPYINDAPGAAGDGYNPAEYGGTDTLTNWAAAFQMTQAVNNSQGVAPLVIFFTDGNPTTPFTNPLGAAIPQADGVKIQGSHIFAVGVPNPTVTKSNLIAVTGPDEFPAPPGTTNDFQIADFTVSNVDDFASVITEIALELCGGTVLVNKIIDLDGDLNTTNDQSDGAGWTFTANPDAPATATPPMGMTDSDGMINFDLDFGGEDEATVDITETVQPGFTFLDASCTGSSISNGTLSGSSVNDIQLSRLDTVFCTFYNQPRSAAIDLQKEGALDLSVVGPSDQADVGDEIDYVIAVANGGNQTLDNVVVVDTVVSLTRVADIVGDNDNLLEAGEVWQYTGTYVLTQADIDAGLKMNTATVTADDPSNNQVTDQDSHTETIGQLPRIDLEKDGVLDPTVVPPTDRANVGDEIDYLITVANTGNVTLDTVVVVDTVASLTRGLDLVGDNDNLLEVGEIWRYAGTYVLTQADIDAGQKVNTATVTANDPNDNPVTDQDTNTETITRIATIDLEKDGTLDLTTVPPGDRANVGDEIDYVVTVANTGNVTLDTVVVVDTVVSLTRGLDLIGDNDNLLEVGEVWRYTGTYLLTQADIDAGQKVNIATVTANDPNDNQVADQDTNTETITRIAAIDLEKDGTLDLGVVAPANQANVGDEIDYVITVTNTGNVTLDTVVVVDTVASLVRGPDLIGDNDNLLEVGEVWRYTGTYVLTQADIDAGQKVNTATVTANDPNDNPVTDQDSNTETITRIATIDLEKDGTLDLGVVPPSGAANVGDEIDYVITVANTGNVTLDTVVVVDTVVGLTRGPDLVGDNDNLLEVGEVWRYTGTYVLTQADINAGQKVNTASVTANDPADNQVTDQDTNTEIIPRNAAIDLEKDGTLDTTVVAPLGRADVGDEIDYVIAVANTGNVTLDTVVVVDTVVSLVRGLDLIGDNDNLLEVGEVWRYTGTYVLTQADINAGQKVNTATVTANDPNDNPVTDQDTNTETITRIATIDLEKDGALDLTTVPPGDRANVGDEIDYVVTVANTGNVTLDTVVVVDTVVSLTRGLDLVGDNDNLLEVGEVWRYTGTYVLTQADIDAGQKTNIASVTANDPNDNQVTDQDTNTETITRIATIDLEKDGTLDLGVVPPANQANVGDEIDYVITVANTGNVTLDTVVVVDTVATLVRGLDLIGDNDNLLEVGEVWRYTGTYVLTQADIDAGQKVNIATVTASDPNDNQVTDQDTNTETITRIATIDLEKDGTLDLAVVPPSDTANVGDEIDYVITVTNTGNVTLDTVVVVDTVVGLTRGPDLVGDNDNLLEVGEVWRYTGTYVLTQADINAGQKVNTATVTANDPADNQVTDQDTNTEVIPRGAAIDLVKDGTLVTTVVAPSGRADVGDRIDYVITVANTGNVTLDTVVVVDTIASLVRGPDLVGNNDNLLEVGEVWRYTGSYFLTQADIDAGQKVNVATVTANDPNDNPVTDQDDNTETIPRQPGIDLVKTGTLDLTVVPPIDRANPGDEIDYVVTVANTGNVTLDTVVVNDPLVLLIRGLDLMGDNDNLLEVGEVWRYTGIYVLTQADIDAGGVLNTALVTANDPTDTPVTDQDTNDEPIPQVPAIDLEKEGALDTTIVAPTNRADVGDRINYVVTVANTGNVTLDTVQVSDPLVTLVRGPDLVGDNDNLLEVGEVWRYTGIYVLTQADLDAGQRLNTAFVTANDPNDNPVTDQDTNNEPLPQLPAIDLEKDGTLDTTFVPPNGQADVGDRIGYVVTVANTGNVTLDTVMVADTVVSLTRGLDLVGDNDNLLEVGEVWRYTGVYILTQADLDAGQKVNTATVTANDPNDNPVTDQDTHTEPLPQRAAIDLVKDGTLVTTVVAPSGRADVGDRIDYVITVANTGTVTLDTVVVVDTIASLTRGLDLVGDNDNLLEVGEVWRYTGSYFLTQADIDAGQKVNVATVTANDPNDNPVTDQDDNTETIPRQPGIDLVKTGTLDLTVVPPIDRANPGDEIDYVVTVANTGNVTLDTVVVNDPLVTLVRGLDLVGDNDNLLEVGEVWRYTGIYVLTQADIDAGGVLNTALVTANDPADTPVTDQGMNDEPIPQVPAIDLEKEGTLDTTIVAPTNRADVGDRINYVVTVANTGNVTLDTVQVSDPLVTLVRGPDLVGDNDNLLEVGEVWRYTGIYVLTQADLDAGQRLNTAFVTANDPNDNPVTDQDTNNEPLPQLPAIDLAKDGTLDTTFVPPNGQADVGDRIAYVITVANTGNVTLDSVMVADTVVSLTRGTDLVGDNDNLLEVGEVWRYTGVYILTQADLDAGQKVNTATVTANDPNDNPVTDQDTHTEPLPQRAAIDLVKDGT